MEMDGRRGDSDYREGKEREIDEKPRQRKEKAGQSVTCELIE